MAVRVPYVKERLLKGCVIPRRARLKAMLKYTQHFKRLPLHKVQYVDRLMFSDSDEARPGFNALAEKIRSRMSAASSESETEEQPDRRKKENDRLLLRVIHHYYMTLI